MKLSSVCRYCSYCELYKSKECKGLLEYSSSDCIRCGGKNEKL